MVDKQWWSTGTSGLSTRYSTEGRTLVIVQIISWWPVEWTLDRSPARLANTLLCEVFLPEKLAHWTLWCDWPENLVRTALGWLFEGGGWGEKVGWAWAAAGWLSRVHCARGTQVAIEICRPTSVSRTSTWPYSILDPWHREVAAHAPRQAGLKEVAGVTGEFGMEGWGGVVRGGLLSCEPSRPGWLLLVSVKKWVRRFWLTSARATFFHPNSHPV